MDLVSLSAIANKTRRIGKNLPKELHDTQFFREIQYLMEAYCLN
jgi:hypothetical protein